MDVYEFWFQYRNTAFSMEISDWCNECLSSWRWIACSPGTGNAIEVFTKEDAALVRLYWLEDEVWIADHTEKIWTEKSNV